MALGVGAPAAVGGSASALSNDPKRGPRLAGKVGGSACSCTSVCTGTVCPDSGVCWRTPPQLGRAGGRLWNLACSLPGTCKLVVGGVGEVALARQATVANVATAHVIAHAKQSANCLAWEARAWWTAEHMAERSGAQISPRVRATQRRRPTHIFSRTFDHHNCCFVDHDRWPQPPDSVLLCRDRAGDLWRAACTARFVWHSRCANSCPDAARSFCVFAVLTGVVCLVVSLHLRVSRGAARHAWTALSGALTGRRHGCAGGCGAPCRCYCNRSVSSPRGRAQLQLEGAAPLPAGQTVGACRVAGP